LYSYIIDDPKVNRTDAPTESTAHVPIAKSPVAALLLLTMDRSDRFLRVLPVPAGAAGSFLRFCLGSMMGCVETWKSGATGVPSYLHK